MNGESYPEGATSSGVCETGIGTGNSKPHDWRLIKEKEEWRVVDDRLCLWHHRRWYCTRCRIHDVTTHDSGWSQEKPEFLSW